MLQSPGKLEDMRSAKVWLEVAELCMEDYTKTGKQEFLDAADKCIDMFEQLEQDIKGKDYSKRDEFLIAFNSKTN